MKGFRKLGAILIAIALVVTSMTYYPKTDVGAASYDTLTYKSLGDDISYNKLSDGIEGMSPASPELLEEGTTLLFAFSADNKNVQLFLNGASVTASDERVVEIAGAVIKVNPKKFDENSYTLITIKSDKGTSEYVIKKGNPTSSGEIPPVDPGQETTASGSVEPGQTTANSEQTTTVPNATSLPKRLLGLTTATVSGTDSIENAVMFAWAGADNKDNVDGYDASVTSVVLYIYKNGTLITKIGNATNGGVIGGLSAGTYTAQAANVNAKGEGPLSETNTFTVTGKTLNYSYPSNCIGPKTPAGLSIITGNPEVPADNPAQADNKLGIAWAASSDTKVPSYDTSVVGYNVYIFDATTGTPYRRAYVEGASNSTVILESVSSGTYLVALSAVNAAGEESALAAPSFGQSSIVTVKGTKIDNAQDFNKPNQPTLPLGLTIITEGIQYGFSVAWSSEADFTGQRLNLFVDGICIKAGINGVESSYYENRLAAGTYTVEVKSQYTDNNVESFGLSKQITIAADPGLETKTPAELADPTYSEYKEETTTAGQPVETKPTPVETTTPKTDIPTEKTDIPTGGNVEVTTAVKGGQTTEKNTTGGWVVQPTTEKQQEQAKITVAKTKIKKATKKTNANKAKIKIKKVANVNGYKVQFSNKKNFKKIILTKNVKKVSFTVKSAKLKKAKKLYVRVKAYKIVAGKTYESKWSAPKIVKITK